MLSKKKKKKFNTHKQIIEQSNYFITKQLINKITFQTKSFHNKTIHKQNRISNKIILQQNNTQTKSHFKQNHFTIKQHTNKIAFKQNHILNKITFQTKSNFNKIKSQQNQTSFQFKFQHRHFIRQFLHVFFTQSKKHTLNVRQKISRTSFDVSIEKNLRHVVDSMLNNVHVEIALEMFKKSVFQKFFFRVFDVKHDVVFRHDAIAFARREKKKRKKKKSLTTIA